MAKAIRRIGISTTALLFSVTAGAGDGAVKPFTVAMEIGLAHFGDPYTGKAEAVEFSPDRSYFAVDTERGRLDVNVPEDSIRIYRSREASDFLRHPAHARPPSPVWTISRATAPEGPVITHWRWLSDSSGIAFLERITSGNRRLVLADLGKRSIEQLTRGGEDVAGFDIRDRSHYVYTVIDDGGLRNQAQVERKAAAIVGTGRALHALLFPYDEYPQINSAWVDRSTLWAVVGGKAFQVKAPAYGRALTLFSEGQRNLALSPDGTSLVTVLPIADVPTTWERLYPPPFAAWPYRVHAGPQDLSTFSGARLVGQYVRIDLSTGSFQPVTSAPTASSSGWAVLGAPAWSSDSTSVLLPGTFIPSADAVPSRPCVTFLNFSTRAASCVEQLKGLTQSGSGAGFHVVSAVRFAGADSQQVVVSFFNPDVGTGKSHGAESATVYRQGASGLWTVSARQSDVDRLQAGHLKVAIMQGLNDPPVLVVSDARTNVSERLWDPNPQLTDVVLGQATVYRWKDPSGRDWTGGLFKPPGFVTGKRYPLVIQTHGFTDAQFRPSGVFPTAFAARALAGVGMVVLQVQDCAILSTPEEGPCNVAGYESAVSQLVKDGIVDPDRIGIVGFSRTCFYVMEALTTSSLHFKSAAITDGVMEDYWQYLFAVDQFGDMIGNEADAMNTARPFGDGLQQWLKRSPAFNLDKVNTPLMVVGEGPVSLMFMWAPYAGLRYLHKPVDLVLLNSGEHVLSNPAERMASQGGSVDWFRFWLEGYEDPDPSKVEQYQRWRELKKAQDAKQNAAEDQRRP
jgi:dipeptidyl aminopeptidase/acylaminoacyl peptidase